MSEGAEAWRCASCGASFTLSSFNTNPQNDPVEVARGVANRGNATDRGVPSDMLSSSLQEQDAVCDRCMRDISASIASGNPVASGPNHHFYNTSAMTSTLPRSRAEWDEALAREFQPFMPMAENMPRLTLRYGENPFQQSLAGDAPDPARRGIDGGDARQPRSPSVETAREILSDAGDSQHGMLSSQGNVHDLLDVLLHDAGDSDGTNFGPWLMARKRFSAQALRDTHADYTPHSRKAAARAERKGVAAANEPIWQDPYAPDMPRDVSYRRVRPSCRGCLHPGAVFVGSQRNGRSSYQVTVEITNVDLNASTLGGYLKICGLTKEWPELTTYFDAEIIGRDFHFVTGKWDATEADDIKHWSRFPEFRTLREQLERLDAPFDPAEQPVVFMRWKEQFLVPDHRVRNINGASFAGFYYICVALQDGDLPPSEAHVDLLPHHARTLSEDAEMADPAASACGRAPETVPDEEPMDPLRAPSTRHRGHMRGFYFHENSEPYQELSLEYIPALSSGLFEFR